jgi:hypothetical protein
VNEALINMLELLGKQVIFVGELSADLHALRTVVSSLDPRIQKALEEQIGVERTKIQEYLENQRIVLAALRQLIASLPMPN